MIGIVGFDEQRLPIVISFLIIPLCDILYFLIANPILFDRIVPFFFIYLLVVFLPWISSCGSLSVILLSWLSYPVVTFQLAFFFAAFGFLCYPGVSCHLGFFCLPQPFNHAPFVMSKPSDFHA